MSAFPLPAVSSASAAVSTLVGLAKAQPAMGRATAEMMAFPARWLGELPMPPSFSLHVAGVPGLIRVGADQTERAAEHEVALTWPEWAALCRGVEADRMWPADLVRVAQRKRDNPAYRLELEDALAGAQVDKSECWELERVLERVDAHLVAC